MFCRDWPGGKPAISNHLSSYALPYFALSEVVYENSKVRVAMGINKTWRYYKSFSINILFSLIFNFVMNFTYVLAFNPDIGNVPLLLL